jgi:hypothetical protein
MYARRRVVNTWFVRAVSFYFGYKILHHEIYEKQTAEPVLIFLGLWLCGIAPATFFDGIRKIAGAESDMEHQAELVPVDPDVTSDNTNPGA